MPWSVTSVDDDSQQNKKTMSGKRKKVPFRTRDGSTESKTYLMTSKSISRETKRISSSDSILCRGKKEKNFGLNTKRNYKVGQKNNSTEHEFHKMLS